MHVIKPSALLAATALAAVPAAACDLEMDGGNGPHRFFAFAGQMAAMRGGSAEQAPARRAPSSEDSSARDTGEEAGAPKAEPAQPESEQNPSDAATFR